METVITLILKILLNLRPYKYFLIMFKSQLPKQKKQANPFCWKEFNINCAKAKVMFLEEIFQLSNGQYPAAGPFFEDFRGIFCSSFILLVNQKPFFSKSDVLL